MPNWCHTAMTIYHEDKEELLQFYNQVKDWLNTPISESDYKLQWLGNIVENAKLGSVVNEDIAYVPCRGEVIKLVIEEDKIFIVTETAWVPCLKMWLLLLEKYLPEADLTYTAEECGMGIFCTNDTSLIGRYHLDIWDVDEYASDLEASEEKVREVLQIVLQSTHCRIDALIELLQKSEYADKMSVHAWEFREASEWN